MELHKKKGTAKNGCSLKISARPVGRVLRNSSVIKKIFLVCITVLIVGVAYPQKALKITRMKGVGWDSYNNKWNEWPAEWRPYQVGSEPILTLYRLDDDGYSFRVNMTIKEQLFSFDITYAGFDQNNNWAKYKDVNGDEVDVAGSTMSNLSLNGWPDTTVQIYFWIYSQNIAYALE
jgi:hypothetical protein